MTALVSSSHVPRALKVAHLCLAQSNCVGDDCLAQVQESPSFGTLARRDGITIPKPYTRLEPLSKTHASIFQSCANFPKPIEAVSTFSWRPDSLVLTNYAHLNTRSIGKILLRPAQEPPCLFALTRRQSTALLTFTPVSLLCMHDTPASSHASQVAERTVCVRRPSEVVAAGQDTLSASASSVRLHPIIARSLHHGTFEQSKRDRVQKDSAANGRRAADKRRMQSWVGLQMRAALLNHR